MIMTAVVVPQEDIDQKNKSFWNELCGSQLAKQLGVVDSSPDSLAKFDDFYMGYYPYLAKYLALDEIEGKNVLEVGLGYGTVTQLLASTGANYHGLDIATNAVEMAKQRLEQINKSGDVREGSMLKCPFPDNYFNFVISIGCFHHTGDMQACVNQTHRVLKKGGRAIIMVYNKFSMRQWVMWPKITAKNSIMQIFSKNNCSSIDQQRAAYDSSNANIGAPETEFFSICDIKKIFKHYESINITRENFDEHFKIKLWKLPICDFGSRLSRLGSKLTRNLGLDLYVVATK